MQRSVAQEGIRAHGADWNIHALACEILELASEGLVAQKQLDDDGMDESRYLDVLKEICESRRTLADGHLEALGDGPFHAESAQKLFESTELKYQF